MLSHRKCTKVFFFTSEQNKVYLINAHHSCKKGFQRFIFFKPARKGSIQSKALRELRSLVTVNFALRKKEDYKSSLVDSKLAALAGEKWRKICLISGDNLFSDKHPPPV